MLQAILTLVAVFGLVAAVMAWVEWGCPSVTRFIAGEKLANLIDPQPEDRK